MTIAKVATKDASQGAVKSMNAPSSSSFEGKLVSLTGNKLVMRNNQGASYSHTLAKDAKLTSDGKACKAEDLKVGAQIRVITEKDNRNVATGIDCITNAKEAGNCCS